MGVLSGGGGYRSGRVASVDGLPVVSVLKVSAKVESTQLLRSSVDATFWTSAMARANKSASVQLSAANTWVQCVSRSGRGVLSAVLSSEVSGADVASVRVIADGVQRDIAVAAQGRLAIGGFASSGGAVASGEGAEPGAGFRSAGMRSAGVAGVPEVSSPTTSDALCVVSAAEAMLMGLPVLEYWSSLQVWFRSSRVPAAAIVDYCGCVFSDLPSWV